MRKRILTREEERVLIERAKSGDTGARDEIVERNLRAVRKLANSLRGLGVEKDDLINVGAMGVVWAIKKFEPERGNKFLTYAHYWIFQSMVREIVYNGATIRVSAENNFLASKAARIKDRTPTLPREELISLISEELSISYARARRALEIAETIVVFSLEESSPGTERPLISRIKNSDAGPEKSVIVGELRKALAERLRKLSAQEREVLVDRYGLNGGGEKTLQEIADQKGLSRERIRQVEKIALAKLGMPRHATHLRHFLNS